MNDHPLPKRSFPIAWWTCGLPGCSHATRAGATFHGMLMERGFAHIVMKPIRLGDMEPSPLFLELLELQRRAQEQRNQAPDQLNGKPEPEPLR